MNKTICPRVQRAARSGLRAAFGPLPLLKRFTTLIFAACFPPAALAAPSQISLIETRVPLYWPTALGAGLILLTIFTITLKARLRRAIDDGEQRAASLKEENNKVYRQLQSYGSELAARQRELAESREAIEQQKQERTDMRAVFGHHLRQPLEAMQSTLNLLSRSGDGQAGELAGIAQRQLRGALQSLEEILRLGDLETVELTETAKLPPGQNPSLAILLVENGEHDSLYTSLEIRGHRVQRESNGVDGADAALQKKFDLVLIDARLPLLDGVEATQRIRRGAGQELPIFAMVAGLQRGDKERYQARGLTGVLAHPVAEFQLEQLLNWGVRRARKATGDRKQPRPTRLLNTNTLCRQRDTLGHLPFAELLSDRSATLPKKTTALTSALTGRHWLDAEKMAQTLAASAEEIGLEAVAARLRALSARLSIDSEREYCRHQRTELLNLMRTSIEQLKNWREQNVHTEWALK